MFDSKRVLSLDTVQGPEDYFYVEMICSESSCLRDAETENEGWAK